MLITCIYIEGFLLSLACKYLHISMVALPVYRHVDMKLSPINSAQVLATYFTYRCGSE